MQSRGPGDAQSSLQLCKCGSEIRVLKIRLILGGGAGGLKPAVRLVLIRIKALCPLLRMLCLLKYLDLPTAAWWGSVPGAGCWAAPGWSPRHNSPRGHPGRGRASGVGSWTFRRPWRCQLDCQQLHLEHLGDRWGFRNGMVQVLSA